MSDLFMSLGPTIVAESEEQWRKARRSLIGASDAAVFYGHGYSGQSLFKLFAEKRTGMETEFTPAQLRRFALGKAAEPVIRQWLLDDTQWKVLEPPSDKFICHHHPDLPFVGATLDSVVIHPHYGLCSGELKRVGYSQRREWEGNAFPLKFWIQCQHQMAVTGTKAAVLAGMIDEDELAVRVITRDDAFIATHLDQCRLFWNMVESGQYTGPIDGEDGTREAIRAVFGPPNPAVVISMPEDADELCVRYKELGDLEKSTKKTRDEINNQLRFMLGEAIEGITTKGTRVILTEVAGCTFVTNRKPYHRLDIKEPKK